MTDYVLKHHGVLGMKWGVRRYQNEDGSRDGKQKSPSENQNGVSKDEIKKRRRDLVSARMSLNPKKIASAQQEYRYAKEDAAFKKTSIKAGKEGRKISKRESSLIDHYKQKGMSDEEAKVSAYKRAKTEKILAATAAVAVTAIAAGAAYTAYKNNTDRIIKKDTVLQRIASNADESVKDAFYFSYDKSDNKKYEGLYGFQLRMQGKDVYKKNLKVTSDMKVASRNNAKKVMKDLFENDPGFRKSVEDLNIVALDGRKDTDARLDILTGKFNNKTYDRVNRLLGARSVEETHSMASKYYDALKSKGYDAIEDVNDKKYSGYKSKDPIIAFTGNAKVNVSKVTKISEGQLDKSNHKETSRMMKRIGGEKVAKIAAGMAASHTVGNVAGTAIKRRSDQSKVNAYKKQHPNTKMSYTEILRSLEREKLNGRNQNGL